MRDTEEALEALAAESGVRSLAGLEAEVWLRVRPQEVTGRYLRVAVAASVATALSLGALAGRSSVEARPQAELWVFDIHGGGGPSALLGARS